ncbi:MAG: hypothetical protein HZC28_20595 [Spirochaetes bacterium]|nr:hypothetical protein [Spirochaetota bacterium]
MSEKSKSMETAPAAAKESAAKTVRKISKEESGDTMNLAAMDDTIVFAEGLGERYNPAYDTIKLAGLKTCQAGCKAAFESLRESDSRADDARNKRAAAFSALGKLSTRVYNAFYIAASKKQAADAQAIVKKVRGGGKRLKDTQNPDAKTISTSQMKMESRIENMRRLVSYVAGTGIYASNETDLTAKALGTHIDSLVTLNDQATRLSTTVAADRIKKDKLFYDGEGSLVDRGLDVKKYIKSAFGAGSPEYAAISKIKFKNKKR